MEGAQQADAPARKIPDRVRQRMLARPAHIREGSRRTPGGEADQPVTPIGGGAENRVRAAQQPHRRTEILKDDPRDIAADDNDGAARKGAEDPVHALPEIAAPLGVAGMETQPMAGVMVGREGEDVAAGGKAAKIAIEPGELCVGEAESGAVADRRGEPPLAHAKPRDSAEHDDDRRGHRLYRTASAAGSAPAR